MTVLFQKLNPAACLPRRATLGSAGYDLCACIEQPLTVKPGQTVPVPTLSLIHIWHFPKIRPE